MKFFELICGIPHRVVCGDPDVEISGIAIDSRLVKAGDLFVATVGREADGHDYVSAAAEGGAVAALFMDGRGPAPGDLPGAFRCAVSVPDTRAVLSVIVNRFHGEPSLRFRLIGITGTNGKTSVAAMINRILERAGRRTGLLGTIGNYCAGEAMDVRRTTPTNPDCVELGEIMGRMADAGVDDLVMEVTSMGLKAGRVRGCDFDVAVFTNLSPEHLDDHGSMEDYKASKLMLFDIAKSAVINADDQAAEEFAARARGPVVRYGTGGAGGRDVDVLADNMEYAAGGVGFDLVFRAADGGAGGSSCRVSLDTPAEFAVYNALAASAACSLAGVSAVDIAAALNGGIDIPGRYQVTASDDGVTVIVDYAHTAQALENLLAAVKSNPAYGRVVSVFGCGGDRDPGKRAPMGEISGRLADYTIITSDNPRTEDPGAIIMGVEEGVARSGGAYEVEPDRARAIGGAIMSAARGDAVVIAGKGHEDYQIIGRDRIHFDDMEQASKAIADRRAAQGKGR
jgi:UDP-N-acetylmuramoyl-L-alanyl-D-glutamate--2,6-diaminopimelate ligase